MNHFGGQYLVGIKYYGILSIITVFNYSLSASASSSDFHQLSKEDDLFNTYSFINPFWQTIPFVLLCSLAGIAVLFFLQNRREHRIKKNNELLEKEVSDRTSELNALVSQLQAEEKKLSFKNQELEKYIESNNQLENFAYIASHDLQAPLRTIKSFVGLLEKSLGSKMNEREKEFFHFISTSTNNMQELINALLTFSRVNSQKRKIQEVNPKELFESIKADLNATLKEEKAKVSIADFPESIHADKIKLKQLLQNLITNGIKFSKKEVNPVVNISCEELPEHWQFEVADNGIGIPSQFNNKIFQLFQRLHNSVDYEGTGIGLALCKKLVEQHDGEIWVKSEEGMGSHFFFTISKALN